VIGHAANAAGATIGALVDLDVGHHRTGVQSPADALALARHISKVNGLRFDGVMFYPGHLKHTPDEQAALIAPIERMVAQTLDLLKRDGLEAKIISGGSTPAAFQSHLIPQQTEIRPGTYIFNDMSTVSVAAGSITIDDCAARMTCTVISTAVPGKFVIDAGSKSLTQDRRTVDPDTAGFGHVVEFPDATIVRLTEEHGEVELGQSARMPKIGERVHVIPNHICPCVNLQTMAWVKDEMGNVEPLAIDARGQVW
jgi:D-serine deaminase-like pyridoxal phosphate-dependent protein